MDARRRNGGTSSGGGAESGRAAGDDDAGFAERDAARARRDVLDEDEAYVYMGGVDGAGDGAWAPREDRFGSHIPYRRGKARAFGYEEFENSATARVGASVHAFAHPPLAPRPLALALALEMVLFTRDDVRSGSGSGFGVDARVWFFFLRHVVTRALLRARPAALPSLLPSPLARPRCTPRLAPRRTSRPRSDAPRAPPPPPPPLPAAARFSATTRLGFATSPRAARGTHWTLAPARRSGVAHDVPRLGRVRSRRGLQVHPGRPRLRLRRVDQWEVLEAASDAPPPFRHLPLPGREHVVRQMNEAVANGLKVVRMWAHTITPGHAMQPEPGAFDEDILEGMDFVMDEARKRGLKIIWAVSDNWYDVGGLNQYVRWSPTARAKEDFFTDAKVHELYVRTFETIATRSARSTGWRTGTADDHGVEPRQRGGARVRSERHAGVDREDVRGVQGHRREPPDRRRARGLRRRQRHGGPQPRERARGGQRGRARTFSATPRRRAWTASACTSGRTTGTSRRSTFSRSTSRNTRGRERGDKESKKPFVLEEFGKIVDRNDPRQNRENERGGRRTRERDEYFAAGFDVAEKLASEGLLAGTLFWHWYDRGVGPGKYGVRSNDSTWALIEKHAEFMNALGGQRAFCEK